MKNVKKIIAATLATVLLAASLTGCGGNKGKTVVDIKKAG